MKISSNFGMQLTLGVPPLYVLLKVLSARHTGWLLKLFWPWMKGIMTRVQIFGLSESLVLN